MNIIRIPLNHRMFYEEFHGEIDNFIYDEFGIMLEDGLNIVFAAKIFFDNNIVDDGIQIHLIVHGGNPVKESIAYEVKYNDYYYANMSVYCNNNSKKWTDIGYDIAFLVLRVITYIMSYDRKRVQKKISLNHNPKEEEILKRNKPCDTKIFLLDEIVEYVDKNGLNKKIENGREIQCPCWSVRGHYRHYKSGKVVFVKNYLKGKKRDTEQPKPKEYFV